MEWALVQQTIAATAQEIYKTFAGIATQPVATYASGLGSCVTKFVTHNPDPVASITSTVLLMTILHFILGNLTGNSSWVDKSWSVLPVYYSWKLWLMAPGPASDPRAAILSGLLAVWGLRLTYNFYRKGGYTWKGEDYRWPIIRRSLAAALPGPMYHIVYIAFDLVIICFFQNALLAGLVAPVYVALYASPSPAPLNILDAAGGVALLTLIIVETVADEQQWEFQTEKHAKISSGKPVPAEYYKGFLTSGLWRYCRHPNFFCEQCIWACVSLFAATGQWVGWWTVPALVLMALFQVSTWLTEHITAAKYPLYTAYQASTSRLLPWWPGAPITTAQVVNFAHVMAAARQPSPAVKPARTRRPSGSTAAPSAPASAAAKNVEKPAKAVAAPAAARPRRAVKPSYKATDAVEDEVEEFVPAPPAVPAVPRARRGTRRA